MFNFLKKKKEEPKVIENKDTLIYSVANGTFIGMENVEDEMFSQKILGDGYAVMPEDRDVYSPVRGTVKSIFPTKHALCIVSDQGDEIILHMGIDTVSLNGVPFNILVSEGQTIEACTKVAEVDLSYLKENNINSSLIVVFSNVDSISEIIYSKTGSLKATEIVGQVVHNYAHK